MIYNLSKKEDIDKLNEKINTYIKLGKKIDLKLISGKRSLNQNAYFHSVICAVFGFEFGLTIEEAKQYFKSSFLTYEKKGIKFQKNTSDLTASEFEDFQTKCRIFASNQGCFIPLPNEVTDELLNKLEKDQKWL